MVRQPEKQARAEVMLGELAEHALMVAKELAVRVRECEDADQTVALANAFQKASRVVRLTLALDFKLDRDAARDARAEAREAEAARAEMAKAEAEAARLAPRPAAPSRVPTPVEARKDRVRGLLNRLLWNESEGDEEEYDILRDDLEARLDEAALSPDFDALPIETLARRLVADMGLSGAMTLSVCERSNPSPLAGEGVRRRPDG